MAGRQNANRSCRKIGKPLPSSLSMPERRDAPIPLTPQPGSNCTTSRRARSRSIGTRGFNTGAATRAISVAHRPVNLTVQRFYRLPETQIANGTPACVAGVLGASGIEAIGGQILPSPDAGLPPCPSTSGGRRRCNDRKAHARPAPNPRDAAEVPLMTAFNTMGNA